MNKIESVTTYMHTCRYCVRYTSGLERNYTSDTVPRSVYKFMNKSHMEKIGNTIRKFS